MKEEFIDELEDLAFQYIEECEENKKEQGTASGKIIKIKDRHIPTINYFLRFWLVKKNKKTICRKTWYNWINAEESDQFTEKRNALIRKKKQTIQNIDELFKCIATDIVANEGKGIFYAKNKLGMTDRVKNEGETKIVHQITGMEIINEQKKIEDADSK